MLCFQLVLFFFFFFKQKTAYEMRISDWSSDVCSSDLTIEAGEVITYQAEPGKAAYVTHRVVEVIMEDGQRSFVTKGDANRGNDVEPVPDRKSTRLKSSH